MAYPIPPGPRIAYDDDGTVGYISGTNEGPGMFQLHPLFLRAMNADSPRMGATQTQSLRAGTSVTSISATLDFPPSHRVVLRFPEPMRIRALAAAGWWGLWGSGGGGNLLTEFNFLIETSDDSTNGVDGTWSVLHNVADNSMFTSSTESSESRADETYGYGMAISGTTGTSTAVYPRVNPNYRRQSEGPGETGWYAVTGSATRQVRWLRLTPYNIASGWNVSSQTMPTMGAWYKLHLYGEPDTAASDNRLVFTDVGGTLKQSFDWGEARHSE